MDNAIFAEFSSRCYLRGPLDPDEFLASYPGASALCVVRVRAQAEIAQAALGASGGADEGGVLHPALPEVGSECDGFRILEQLGRGAMGVVFRAEEVETGRQVALKLVSPDLSSSLEAAERFQEESRITASITHEHCVFVYGVHAVATSLGLSMELLEGGTLQDVIDRDEQVSTQQALEWTLEILAGVEAAHRAGVIHRDLKPSNCFLTSDGHIKVGDFGVSLLVDAEGRAGSGAQLAGSPGYAAPEQFRSLAEVDERSDVYGVAGILYALLTGRPPHAGRSRAEVYSRALACRSLRPQSLRKMGVEAPRMLEQALLKAMDPKQRRRYMNPAALRKHVAPFLSSRWVPASLAARVGAFLIDDLLALKPILMLLLATLEWFAQGEFTLHAPNAVQEAFYELGLVSALYFVLSEKWTGTTLGKRVLGLRVTGLQDRPICWRQVLGRALVFQAAFIVADIAWLWVGDDSLYYLLPFVAGLLALAVEAIRVQKGRRPLHEHLSSTQLVRIELGPGQSGNVATTSRVPSPTSDQSLESYQVTGCIGAGSLGRLLSGKDLRLERAVWLVEHRGDLWIPGGHHRSEETFGALRWIECVELPGCCYDVFEATQGEPLLEWAERTTSTTGRPVEWRTVVRILASLCDSLEHRSRSVSLSQLWIDPHGQVRITPVPLEFERVHLLGPVEAIGEIARALLQPVTKEGKHWFPHLPAHALTPARRLCSAELHDEELPELARQIHRILHWNSAVRRRHRIKQAIASSWRAVVLGLGLVAFFVWDDAGRMEKDRFLISLVGTFSLAGFVFALTSLASAFLFRGGFWFSAFGIQVLDAWGARASRGRCTLRMCAGWAILIVPLLVGLILAAVLQREWISGVFLALGVGLSLANFVMSMRLPWTSFHDRLCRTHLAPI